jgi:hypothetical protein
MLASYCQKEHFELEGVRTNITKQGKKICAPVEAGENESANTPVPIM